MCALSTLLCTNGFEAIEWMGMMRRRSICSSSSSKAVHLCSILECSVFTVHAICQNRQAYMIRVSNEQYGRQCQENAKKKKNGSTNSKLNRFSLSFENNILRLLNALFLADANISHRFFSDIFTLVIHFQITEPFENNNLHIIS